MYSESNADHKRKSPILLTSQFGEAFAAHPSFLGNQLPNHPELQVVLPAQSPSQACSNWRGNIQFITVNSGNKYSVSRENITDTTRDLILLPSAGYCRQQFLYRILQVVANTYAKIIYTRLTHSLLFHLQKGCVYLCSTIVIIPPHWSTEFSLFAFPKFKLVFQEYFILSLFAYDYSLKDIWKCACFK